MTRQLITTGSPFEAQMGYSRAMVAGDWVFVSGTTGFDYSTMTISENIVEQAEQCFRNISAALAQADSSLADVVRVTYVLPIVADFEPCWPVMQKHLGTVRPAAMMISAALVDPRMKIEIEVTALKQVPRVPSPASTGEVSQVPSPADAGEGVIPSHPAPRNARCSTRSHRAGLQCQKAPLLRKT